MKKPLIFTILLAVPILFGCSSGGGGRSDTSSGGGTPSSASSTSGIPAAGDWVSHMNSFGRAHCNRDEIQSLSTWEGSVWYYDGMRVYQQIADYTGDSSWNACVGYVRDVYRAYVLDNNGELPGWRVFAEGLAEDFRRTGDENSKRAAILLSKNSAFASQGGGESFELSRETALLINAYLTAETLGESRNGNLATSVNFALGHIDQWVGSKSAKYVKPFMMGLTFEALIRYFEATGDSRVLAAVKQGADWLWSDGWSEDLQAFPYIICRPGATNDECKEDHSGEGADLSLLIAPAYAWLFRMTGDDVYRERGDKIFQGGVERAYLGGGKQFSQNYRWSFDYVRWRQ